MIDPKKITELVQSVMDSLPSGLKNMPNEVEKNFRSSLSGVFNRLDLVTRDEFDAQAAVLLRTRKKLEQLEKKLMELEKQK